MASRKFRFVSPGVFLKEIDKSQLPGIPDGVGLSYYRSYNKRSISNTL